jgi:hypothetical protein
MLDVLSWQESRHKILLQEEKQSVLAPRNFTGDEVIRVLGSFVARRKESRLS